MNGNLHQQQQQSCSKSTAVQRYYLQWPFSTQTGISLFHVSFLPQHVPEENHTSKQMVHVPNVLHVTQMNSVRNTALTSTSTWTSSILHTSLDWTGRCIAPFVPALSDKFQHTQPNVYDITTTFTRKVKPVWI